MLNAELRPGFVGPVPAAACTQLFLPSTLVALLAKPVEMRVFPVPPMLKTLLSEPSADPALLLPVTIATLPNPGVPRSFPANAPGKLPVALGPKSLLPMLTARFPVSFALAPAWAYEFLPTANAALKLPFVTAVEPSPIATAPLNSPLEFAVAPLPTPTAKLVGVLVQPPPVPTPLMDAQVASAVPAAPSAAAARLDATAPISAPPATLPFEIIRYLAINVPPPRKSRE